MASSLPSLEQEIQPTRWPWFRVYRQPWKTIYLASQLSYHHLVRKPFSAILFLIPALRPNPKWTWQQSRFVTLLGEFFHIATQAGLIHSRKDIRKEDMASAEKCGKDCQGKFVDPVLEDDIVGEIREIMVKNEVHPAGVPAYWRGHGIGNSPISPAGEDERLVIHFHGGGYVTGSALQGEVPSTILALSQAHPSKPISRVLDVDYRLCRTTPLAEPANAFPAALLDAVSVMYYAVFDLGFHPRNIVFSGNSAGAHVILGATRYLRDAPLPASRLNAKGVPHHLEGVTSLMPGGMILIAPLCNVVSMYFEQRSPESSFVRNATTDIIGRHADDQTRPEINSYALRGFAGKALTRHSLARNPFVSPGSVDCPLTISTSSMDGSPAIERPTFEGYPPTYFSFGGKEVMSDEIRLCAQRFDKQSALKELPLPSSAPSGLEGNRGPPSEMASTVKLIPDQEELQPKPYPWIVMDEEPELWHNFVAIKPPGLKESRRTLESIVAWLAALPPAKECPV